MKNTMFSLLGMLNTIGRIPSQSFIEPTNGLLGMLNTIGMISIYKVEDFKGLESNVIIYIHSIKSNTTINYVAYTRAKYYLYEFVIK